jgi:hypothetical protein
MSQKVATAITATAFAFLSAAPALAQSSKAAWRFKEVIALSQSADTDPDTTPPTGPTETNWVNILRTHIKTPNLKELAIGVSLQCGILTDTTVRSKGGDPGESEDHAAGWHRGVCRARQRWDSHGWCAPRPETLRLILKTLDANHFNFIHVNAVPGVQTIEVQAKAAAGVALGGTRLGDAGAEAFVGSGALYVETIRLVKDADGTTDLDNLR